MSAFAVSVSEQDAPAKQTAPITVHGTVHGGAEAEDEKPFIHLLFHDPTAFFTMVLAVFTMALASFTWRLFQITKLGIIEQANLTRTSVGLAEVSARAAETAIYHANLSSERQLRAYIGIDEGALSLEAGATATLIKIVAQVTLKNFGASPARDISVSAKISMNKNAGRVELKLTPGKSVLFPSVSHKVRFSEEFEAADADRIILTGIIEYEDAFAKKRTTTFRLRAIARDDTSRRYHLAACEKGNDFD